MSKVEVERLLSKYFRKMLLHNFSKNSKLLCVPIANIPVYWIANKK